MKHTIFAAMLLCTLLAPPLVFSQENTAPQLSDTVPFNPAVRRVTLPNGFTYYLARNTSEPGKIYVNLNVKAGMLQDKYEPESCHIMEHIVFRSSLHYPAEKSLKEYLKANSITYNAHPNVGNTTFYFFIPADTAIMENICLAFQDWVSGKSSLTDEDVSAEKSIVAEEYMERTKGGAPSSPTAISGMLQPSTASDAYRLMASDHYQDKIVSASNASLRQFYKDWYRPDLSGLIIVGDIDIATTERIVRRLFADLPNPAVQPGRVKYPFTLNGNNKYITDLRAYGTDKHISMEMLFLKERHPKVTYGDYKDAAMAELFNSMMSSRLGDLYKTRGGQMTGSVHGGIGEGLLGHRLLFVQALSFHTSCESEKSIESSMKKIFTESERVRQYGFNGQELDSARAALLTSTSSADPERKEEEGRRYTDYFVYSESAPAATLQAQLRKKFLSEITLQEINQAARAWITDQNRSIVLWAPGRSERQIPGEATVLSWLKTIQQSPIARYEVSRKKELRVNFESLYPIPSPASYTRKDLKGGVTQLKLANGVTVMLKAASPSSDNRIRLESVRPVGAGGYTDSKYLSTLRAPDLLLEAGLGELNKEDLDAYMEQYKIRSNAEIFDLETRINGGAPNEELEKLLQLTYRYFLVPRKDSDAYAFKINLMTQWANPMRSFISKELSAPAGYRLLLGNALAPHLSLQEVKSITYQQCLEGYNACFSSPREFTFALTGVRDMEKAVSLVTKYLGNLPVRKENPPPVSAVGPKNPNFHVEKTAVNKSLRKEEAEVLLIYAGYHSYSPKEAFRQRILSRVMESILMKRLREKEAGVYSTLSAGVLAQKIPGRSGESWYELRIKFPCEPSIRERLIRAAEEEIELLKKDGPSQIDFDSAVKDCKTYVLSSGLEDALWSSVLLERYQNNQDLSDLSDRDAAFNSIRPADIQQAAREYLVKTGYIRYVELPGVR